MKEYNNRWNKPLVNEPMTYKQVLELEKEKYIIINNNLKVIDLTSMIEVNDSYRATVVLGTNKYAALSKAQEVFPNAQLKRVN